MNDRKRQDTAVRTPSGRRATVPYRAALRPRLVRAGERGLNKARRPANPFPPLAPELEALPPALSPHAQLGIAPGYAAGTEGRPQGSTGSTGGPGGASHPFTERTTVDLLDLLLDEDDLTLDDVLQSEEPLGTCETCPDPGLCQAEGACSC